MQFIVLAQVYYGPPELFTGPARKEGPPPAYGNIMGTGAQNDIPFSSSNVDDYDSAGVATLSAKHSCLFSAKSSVA